MIAPVWNVVADWFISTVQISLQAALIALLVFAAQFLLRKHLFPRWRYALWFLVIARLVMPMLPESPLSWQRLLRLLPPQGQATQPRFLAKDPPFGPILPPAAPAAAPLEPDNSPANRKITITRILGGLWLGGVLVLFTGIAILHGRFRRSLRSAHRCREGEPLAVLMAACAATMRIRRKPRILKTPLISTPAISGIFRPVLLLPDDFETAFTPEEQRMVFLHELAHVRRGDLLLNPLLTALQVVHWFNPILWIAFSRLRFDRECATDSLVLSGDRVRFRSLYGETLLKLLAGVSGSPARLPLLGILENKTRLQERCRDIRSAVPGAYGFSAFGLILLGALGMATLTQSSLTAADTAPRTAEATVLPPDTSNFDPTKAAMAGTKLTAEAAEKLAREIAANPDDPALRIKLLGYYFLQRTMQPSARDAAQPHSLWVINHWPASPAAGLPYVQIVKQLDPSHYAEARTAWLDQMAKHPGNARIFGNAAAFLQLGDPKEAEKYLRHARALDPSNTEWSQRLGQFLTLQTLRGPNPLFPNASQEALQAYEDSIKGLDGEMLFYRLTDLPKAALNAGEDGKARAYAEQLLALAPGFRANCNYGNAIYTGNCVLGSIALQKGDPASAATFLLAAGGTPGSPQLNSFGPDFSLAQKLLDAGKRETVVTFLDQVARFWKGHETTLGEWQAAIRQGGTPKLGRSGI